MTAPHLLLALCIAWAPADESEAPSPRTLVAGLQWRNLGPSNMGGRVIDLAVDPDRTSTFYVATASGGVFKTTNHGTTFQPMFDGENCASIGAIALAPSVPSTVWVGTGEANPRNSVSWGKGVFCSEDGGETWSQRGLEDSKHIGAIAVDPKDPARVFVAAMGHTWGPNETRGLFRTTDAGQSWQKVLFVDEQTGCIDVIVDPHDPRFVYAATYQRQRDQFDGGNPAVRWGPGSGIWRSTDRGDHFERVTEGLPTVDMGRIGLALSASEPGTLWAIIETVRTGRSAPERTGPAYLGIRADGEDVEGGHRIGSITTGGPADLAGLLEGDVLQAIGEHPVQTLADLQTGVRAYKAGEEVELKFLRDGEPATAKVKLGSRPGSQGQFSSRGSMLFQGGQGPNAQDSQGPSGFETGGLFRSQDHGKTFRRMNSLNPRPFYYSQLRVAPSDPKVMYVLGIAVHKSEDGGASFANNSSQGAHPDHHALWIDKGDPEHVILGNDGGVYVSWDGAKTWDLLDNIAIGQFYNVAVDTSRPYRVYGGLQDNGSWGGPSATRRKGGVRTADWVQIGGGDGFHCAVDPTDPNTVYSESQNGRITRIDLRTGHNKIVDRPSGRRRYNWNTPFLLSPHNPHTLYFAGSEVCRSIDRGDHSITISPEITRTSRGSATALCESPRTAGLLYVGTDDGELFVSPDGGRQWESVYLNLPGVSVPLYVSDIEASHHAADTVYVSLDGHRSDDYHPYLFVSTDAGGTFESVTGDLPGEGSVRTVVEDPSNRNLLFVGTEFGAFVSIDRGEHWNRLGASLPAVPVHDLVIHPRCSDLVAGTHGRGIWILDIAPLQQLQTRILAKQVHLFDPQPAHLWNRLPGPAEYGARRFRPDSAENGATFYYYLREDHGESVSLEVLDVLGKKVATVPGPAKPGIQNVVWNLRGPSLDGQGPGVAVEAGDYQVRLAIGDNVETAKVTVYPDPEEEGGAGLGWGER